MSQTSDKQVSVIHAGGVTNAPAGVIPATAADVPNVSAKGSAGRAIVVNVAGSRIATVA